MKALFTATILVCFTLVQAQQNWLPLTYPESDILGRPVDQYNGGKINYSVEIPPLVTPKIDVVQSADDIDEYDKVFSNFITKYFSSEKFNIQETHAKKLLIKSLNIEAIENMNRDVKYVYAGITADSVDVIIRFKKEKDVDYSKFFKDLDSFFHEIL